MKHSGTLPRIGFHYALIANRHFIAKRLSKNGANYNGSNCGVARFTARSIKKEKMEQSQNAKSSGN